MQAQHEGIVRRVCSPAIVLMSDRGLFLSLRAIRRQLAAMPCDLYLVRLIHHATRTAFPGERLWTAAQLPELEILHGCSVAVVVWLVCVSSAPAQTDLSFYSEL